MNITRAQYEADIRKAKADAWEEGVEFITGFQKLAQYVDHNPYRDGTQ